MQVGVSFDSNGRDSDVSGGFGGLRMWSLVGDGHEADADGGVDDGVGGEAVFEAVAVAVVVGVTGVKGSFLDKEGRSGRVGYIS